MSHLVGNQEDKFPSGEAHLSLVVRKPDFCICENKDADQLRSNCAADQRLCFRHIDSTIPFLSKSEILSPVCVGPGRKPRRPVFSQRGSFKSIDLDYTAVS